MSVLMGGKRYAVDSARLIAYGEQTQDASGEGIPPRATFLFRTEDRLYFIQYRVEPMGGDPHDERVWIEPVSEMDAAALFAELDQKQMTFQEAFR